MIAALLREKDLCPGSLFCNDHPSQHADDCPVVRLKESMLSGKGMLLNRAMDLQFSTEHFQISLDDIPADEYNVMRVLQQERNRYEREQMDKAKTNAPRQTPNRH